MSTAFAESGQVEAPTFTPPYGPLTPAQQVSLSTTTPDAVIVVTDDGTEPSTTSPVYRAPLTPPRDVIFKARAYRDSMLPSEVSTVAYEVGVSTVATPVFEPKGGYVPAGTIVSLSCATAGATIRYTVDGSPPSMTHGTIYTNPVSLGASGRVRAVAYTTEPSHVAEATFDVLRVENPGFSPAGPNVFKGALISIVTGTLGSSIRYTTNGTDPTPSTGTLYTGPVRLDADTTLKAIAYQAGYLDSDVVSQSFVTSPPPFNGEPTWGTTPGTVSPNGNVVGTIKGQIYAQLSADQTYIARVWVFNGDPGTTTNWL